MFKNIYNRCKAYLNSYVSFGIIFTLLFLLFLPAYIYKPCYGFYYLVRFAYQYNIINTMVILIEIFNIWRYLHKFINITYQAHRYGSLKKLITNNICDLLFISFILELVYFILNISMAIFINDGYYLSTYKYYGISDLVYLIYNVIVRLSFVSIISIITYYIYYTDNNFIKGILLVILLYNTVDIDSKIPFTMNSILCGSEFSSFIVEIGYVIFFIFIYVIFLLILKKVILNKKRGLG
jgi:hypothetical protein